MHDTLIYIVIPNWNGLDVIKNCLQALEQQTQPHQVVVVDNGSTDGSVEYLDAQGFEYIALPKNTGFAGGVNRGIEYSLERGAEYIGLINNDAQPQPEWLAELLQGFDYDPSIGIATGRFVSTKGTIDSAGDYYSLLGLAFPRGRDEPDDSDKYAEDEYVPSATGGASLYKAQVFQDIGLFDERFFAYYEDVDLGLRAQRAGYKVRYCPKAVAIHDWGTTTKKVSGLGTYCGLKNQQFLLLKAMPLRYVPLALPIFYGFTLPSLIISHSLRGNTLPALKGAVVGLLYAPYYALWRLRAEYSMKISGAEYADLVIFGVPPRQKRKIRAALSKLGVK